jgi:multiple antibiotic resistance protein
VPDWWESFVLTFVPLFIVIDAIGNLPLLLSLSQGMSPGERRRMVHVAILTAAAVGLAFLFLGQFVLRVMGISVGALAIAGGLILLVLSIRFMMTGHVAEASREEMVAVVPIGTPLLSGPATIATLLLLASQFSLAMVLASFALNMVIAWGVFLLGNQVARLLGRGGLRAISQVFNLLLAAIAVSMIIRGLDLLGFIEVAWLR